MPPGENTQARREFVRGILHTVKTLEQSRGCPVPEAEILDKLSLKEGFTEEFTSGLLTRLDNHAPCPLCSREHDGQSAYFLRRSDTVGDFIAGLGRDGIDPINL